MAVVDDIKHDLKDAERQLLVQLRLMRRNLRAQSGGARAADELTLGQKIADLVAAAMGSWKFIIIQSTTLAVWIVLRHGLRTEVGPLPVHPPEPCAVVPGRLGGALHS